MTTPLSRRQFLGGLGLLGVAGATAALPAAPARAASPHSGELATLLDLSKCVGCGACAQACKDANAARFPEPKKPFPPMLPKRVKVEDWSDKREVDDRLTPYTWLYIDHFEGQRDGQPFELHMPRRCMHCQNPPCANLCPWGSCSKDDRGVVEIDPVTCLGGAKCRDVCPWSIPQRQTGVGLYLDLLPRFAGNGVMYKCDRCAARLDAGQLPACIEACPFEVQQIGPREEIVAKAKALAAEMHGFVYGLDENGGTNTIYVSPVPFETLEASRAKGPGRPHLAAVEDPFENQTLLAAALVAAPLAGLAGAALRTVSRMKRGADHE
ncbi:4Fe-4S dicluster domain-containing protein [Megalodesulfovibrio gigas]|uniref:Putative 4Fe-4S ferredoxin iron-sulfur binding domain protein n=1 Tax=Megalodesulfovibrio gigas (strain ATCC 19364 / DSM 1382 / NCIMB 9332 / VKM B-1759) TaxID=1121448 RepID=T2G7M8_MEGG1|nr:4Fe-4S dicluster domain-containing protein [Megalodesulfovibrio gigas]AGW12298.1 putative 4Fe-4S ferredoxin iron-sulfur binding domain protein [Megalodesulfovibrio gigas DSM 1382 = ATCC 19364]